jgi:hypothetical protein
MKGVINKGIQEFVTAELGATAWEEIKTRAECDEPFFAISLDYPDEMTHALVEAASAVTGRPTEELMVRFGRFMIPNTLRNHYPTYMKLVGTTPRQFLLNMKLVHQYATRSITNAKPPTFGYEELPDGRLLLHYSSSRRLCAILQGLIYGVGDLFDHELRVREVECMKQGSPRCTIEVTFP